jgi:hypothetical protein
MRFRYVLSIGVIFLFLASCAPTANCAGAQNTGTTVTVLFIGNSYTYVNDLPAAFSKLSCSGGHKVESAVAAEGGWTLVDHLASTKTLEKLKQQKWDYVVLQEQSEIPAVASSRRQSMYPAVRKLVAQIRALGAQPVLFITWGHRDGLPQASEKSYQEMQDQVEIGYTGIAQELGVLAAPVGSAWQKARAQAAPIDLWQADGSHPNEQGTYLAACVFYATIFHESPEGLSDRGGFSQETAQTLQSVAAEAALKAK